MAVLLRSADTAAGQASLIVKSGPSAYGASKVVPTGRGPLSVAQGVVGASTWWCRFPMRSWSLIRMARGLVGYVWAGRRVASPRYPVHGSCWCRTRVPTVFLWWIPWRRGRLPGWAWGGSRGRSRYRRTGAVRWCANVERGRRLLWTCLALLVAAVFRLLIGLCSAPCMCSRRLWRCPVVIRSLPVPGWMFCLLRTWRAVGWMAGCGFPWRRRLRPASR